MAVDVDAGGAVEVQPIVITDSGLWSIVRPRQRSQQDMPMIEDRDEYEREGSEGDGVQQQQEDSSSRAYRARRKSSMDPRKGERMDRLSAFLRSQRERAAMTQKEVTTRANTYKDLTDKVSTGLVPHLEALSHDALNSSDVGLFKIWAILRAVGATLADLEHAIERTQPERLSEQQEQERALLATFRALSPFARRTVVDQARYWLGVESSDHARDLSDIQSHIAHAADAYTAAEEADESQQRNGAC